MLLLWICYHCLPLKYDKLIINPLQAMSLLSLNISNPSIRIKLNNFVLYLCLVLQPENIMLLNRNSHEVKLIDFGLSRKLLNGKEIREMIGTPEFVGMIDEQFSWKWMALNKIKKDVLGYVGMSGLVVAWSSLERVLKTVDTISNCQRPVFSLGVS